MCQGAATAMREWRIEDGEWKQEHSNLALRVPRSGVATGCRSMFHLPFPAFLEGREGRVSGCRRIGVSVRGTALLVVYRFIGFSFGLGNLREWLSSLCFASLRFTSLGRGVPPPPLDRIGESGYRSIGEAGKRLSTPFPAFLRFAGGGRRKLGQTHRGGVAAATPRTGGRLCSAFGEKIFLRDGWSGRIGEVLS